MTEFINLLSDIDDNDRAVFIVALDEFTKEIRHYSKDRATASFNKKQAKSAKNKIEVKAQRFSADEIRVLYIALYMIEENLVSIEQSGFTDDMSAQLHATLDKFLPKLEEFVNSLLK